MRWPPKENTLNGVMITQCLSSTVTLIFTLATPTDNFLLRVIEVIGSNPGIGTPKKLSAQHKSCNYGGGGNKVTS